MNILANIWQVYLDTAFWLLLGLIAAGLIKAWVPESLMQRWLGGRGVGAVGRAALVGAPLPLCSCGVLPVALGLRRGGASREATVSFLISTPETSVDSIAVTYALMGPFMAVVRPLAAVATAMVAGLLTALVPESAALMRTAGRRAGDGEGQECMSGGGETVCVGGEEAACCTSGGDASCCEAAQTTAGQTSAWVEGLRYSFSQLLDDMILWLAAGIVVAGLVLSFVPPDLLSEWGSGPLALLLMLVVGIPMYVCATASTPIAAAMLLAGVSPGAVLVFLLVGPATNFAGLAIIGRELGRAVLWAYLGGLALTSLLLGMLVNILVDSWDIEMQAEMQHAHGVVPEWLAITAAVLLLLLALKPLRRRLLGI